MQWLIDIAIAAMEQYLVDNPRYVDRGDVAAPDYAIGAFTKDGTWHDLDLSAIVPANAVCVHTTLWLNSDAVADLMTFRKKGHTGFGNVTASFTPARFINGGYDLAVGCDANRVIQYKADNVPWFTMSLSIRGWWL